MSTLTEIEAAVEQLPRAQQEELHVRLSLRLASPPRQRFTAEELRARLKIVEGVGLSGLTTDEIMAMTRGEE